MLRATTACTFSTSQLPKVVQHWCVLYILTWKCASRHNGVHFFISHLASWVRTRRFSEPTFRPSGATNHWKNTVNRDFPTFSRICIFFLLIFSLLTLLTSAFQLSILSEVSLLNFLRRVPLHIPKHSTKITCPCTNPFRHLVRATPKTTRKPFRGHGRGCWPRPPGPPQRSAARPRRRGRSEPPNTAASGLGRRGCDAEGGRLRLPSRNKAIVYSHGMFLRVVGQIFLEIGHRSSCT